MPDRLPLILASNSPRRRQLLRLGGWEFQAFAVEVDETPKPGEAPAEYVRRLAREKAHAAATRRGEIALYLGADTTVVLDGEYLGKPRTAAEAVWMLHRLRGRVHQVYSGVAVFRSDNEMWREAVCVTDVPMRAYTDEEIEAYVRSGDPMDKAGAYAIQHPEFRPVARMEGCFASVMGLPLCHLTALLATFGLPATTDVPEACQKFLDYQCSYYPQILQRKVSTDEAATITHRWVR